MCKGRRMEREEVQEERNDGPEHQPPQNSTQLLNWKSVVQLSSILKILCTGNTCLLFSVLLVLCIGQQFIIYNIGLLPSHFFTVLGGKQSREFKPLLVKSFSLIILIALCKSAVQLTSGHLYVVCRESLTNHLHKNYFKRSAVLYHINNTTEIDNVDQRITQDVERLCTQLRELASKLIISPFTIVYYSMQCFRATGYVGPIVIYAYFVLATVVNKVIMTSIVGLVFAQEKCEGDFRYWHMMVRTYAESIFFLKGERKEMKNVSGLFFKLLLVQRRIINREMVLNLSTYFFDYVGSILSYIVISVPIFAGRYDSLSPVRLTSLISENAFVSMYLISCFSSLIDMSAKVTDLFAYVHRVGQLQETLGKYGNGDESAENDHGCGRDNACVNLADEKTSFVDGKDNAEVVDLHYKRGGKNENLLTVRNVTFSAPESSSAKDLVVDLNFTVQQGINLFVTGKAGCGKTTLLRVILGMWRACKGSTQVCLPSREVVFLPQKVFLTQGSLLDQVVYPRCKREIHDYKSITNILEEVGLGSVITRIGGIDVTPHLDWSKLLSPGESQRLSFARVLFHCPVLAVLDEPTSGIDEEGEGVLFAACCRRSITVLTVGHRETLKNYHNVNLQFLGNGQWKMTDL